jgi:hypothetical protein
VQIQASLTGVNSSTFAIMAFMPDKLTRRRWSTTLAAAPLLAAPVLASTQTPPQEPPQDDLTVQRANLQRWREQMKQVKLPRATEPAFVFKA